MVLQETLFKWIFDPSTTNQNNWDFQDHKEDTMGLKIAEAYGNFLCATNTVFFHKYALQCNGAPAEESSLVPIRLDCIECVVCGERRGIWYEWDNVKGEY